MFGYQRIITSLNIQLPLSACNIKFRNLAASYPMLPWDIRHLDTWVECLSIPKLQPEHWHCGSMYHYPDHCPFRPGTSTAPPDGQLPPFRHPGIAPTAPTSINQNFPQAANPTPSQPRPLFPPQSPARFCRDFNNRGTCQRINCQCLHICEQCKGAHPKCVCPPLICGEFLY